MAFVLWNVQNYKHSKFIRDMKAFVCDETSFLCEISFSSLRDKEIVFGVDNLIALGKKND